MGVLTKDFELTGKLSGLTPGSKGQSILVRVLNPSEHDTVAPARTEKNAAQEVLVADDTGCILVTASAGNAEKLVPGTTVKLANCRVNLRNGHMRLHLDKFSQVIPSTATVEEFSTERNFSSTEYRQLRP